jgi:hypothetical protein
MLKPRSFPAWAISSLCLAVVQLAWLPAPRAEGIPSAAIAFREIKLTGNEGNIFALGFVPLAAGELYWAADRAGVAQLYTYDLGPQKVSDLTGVIPPSFLPSGFAWSPDGRQAALVRGPVLKVVGINVHATKNLFMGASQWGPMFWTPNHSILTACAPDAQVARKLCAADTSTGLVSTLASPGEGSVYAVGYVEGANKLIYERWNPGEGSNPVHLYSASIFSDHVGNIAPLTYPDVRGDGYVTVTPDGEYGVTLGRASQTKDTNVYLGDFVTGNWMRLNSPAAWGRPVMAVLSPDHLHLVVATSDDKRGYRLWLTDVPDKIFRHVEPR